MIVKKLRLQKCWSQEQLSQFSGLSVRTIQRIERGHQASLESLKSIAAVFQININDLQPESNMDTKTHINSDNSNNEKTIQVDIEEKKAMEYVEGVKAFYQSLVTFFIVISCLTAVNLSFNPEYLWVLWCAGGWGVGIIVQGIYTFELFSLFSPEWEKRQIEKRLGRGL